VAQRLRASTRHTDIIGRLGGDEFAVIQRVPDVGRVLDAGRQTDARADLNPSGQEFVGLGEPLDELLRSVAQRLRASTRHTDIIGRLGGDEFAVIQRVPPTAWP
jgi:GGDEF domain-containing protein